MMGKFCKQEPDPILFNCMLCVGVFLSSVLVIASFPFVDGGISLVWTWWGALAGSLLVLATLFSFVAVPRIGLAVASATWSCSSIIVAFCWGAIGPEKVSKPMQSPAGSVIAICCLILGVLTLINSSFLAQSCFGAGTIVSARGEVDLDGQEELNSPEQSSEQGKVTKVSGLASALLVGLFGGSILVPASFTRSAAHGFALLPSFGAGALVMGTAIGVIYVGVSRGSVDLRKELQCDTVSYGIIAGFLWNLGNIAQVAAMQYWNMPYGISYPILQCGLIVSGFWGIYYFKEVRSVKAIMVFWMGVAIVIFGVTLLGFFGPGTRPKEIIPSLVHPPPGTEAFLA